METFFRQLARTTSQTLGSSKAFFIALVFVLGWLASGKLFGYSDTWQLFINTTTTIVTFLMVVLIQHTQNHDARALHLKMDELLRAGRKARTSMVELEEMTDEELDRIHTEFQGIRDEAIRRQTRP